MGWSGWLSQTSPIPRSPDSDKKGLCVLQVPRVINFYCAVYHQYNDLSYNDSGQLEWFGWSVWSSGWGDFVVQLVEVSSGRSWCLSGLDCHSCQSCVFLRVGRLVTGQYILDGKVVRKLRLVGAVYLVDWLDVGPVVGMLESSSQDDISNTG